MRATTLIITNDFPPKIGGIEGFVAAVCDLLDGDVVVLTSNTDGATEHDHGLGYPVIRTPQRMLLPSRTVAARAVSLLHETGATRVIFGAAAPLSLLARELRASGAERILALTHGHEVWWSMLPGARRLLRRMGDDVDHLSAISDYTSAKIAAALSPGAASRMIRLAPPVDLDQFSPDTLTADHRPRCIAAGRFITQKGFGVLLRAWGELLREWGSGQQPELVLVGDGPRRPSLVRMSDHLGIAGTVRFTGSLPRSEMIMELRRADVFALPVRTRLGGLNPEGLGLVFLEAAATGLPVIVGDSGGAPETVRDGETGYVIDSDDVSGLADRLGELLHDRPRARQMGAAGRSLMRGRFDTETAGATLRAALKLDEIGMP